MSTSTYSVYSRPDLIRAQLGLSNGPKHWPAEFLEAYRSNVVDHFVPCFWFDEGSEREQDFCQRCELAGFPLNRDRLTSVDDSFESAGFEYYFFNAKEFEEPPLSADFGDVRSSEEAAYVVSSRALQTLVDYGATGVTYDHKQDPSRVVVAGRLNGPGHLRWCERSRREPVIFFFGVESFYLRRADVPSGVDLLAVREFAPDHGKQFSLSRDFVLISAGLLARLVDEQLLGLAQHSLEPPIQFRPVEILE